MQHLSINLLQCTYRVKIFHQMQKMTLMQLKLLCSSKLQNFKLFIEINKWRLIVFKKRIISLILVQKVTTQLYHKVVNI